MAREAAPHVLRLLGDRRAEVRALAARCLGLLGCDLPASVQGRLLRRTRDRDSEVRAAAISALGDLRPKGRAFLGRFVEVLSDTGAALEERTAAAIALGNAEAQQALPAIARVLADPEDHLEVRADAAYALGLTLEGAFRARKPKVAERALRVLAASLGR